MIQWWVWLLLWVGLTVLLLLVLTVFLWRLFRKFLVVLDEATALAERGRILEIADNDLVRQERALLSDISVVRARAREHRLRRKERNRIRREARLARARAITSINASRTDWPRSWYGARAPKP